MTDIDEMAAEIVRLRRDRECMTLRDYFAGQAIAGLCANPNYDRLWDESALKAYRAADALLKARTQGES